MFRSRIWLAIVSGLLLSACASGQKVAPVSEASRPIQAEPASAVEPEIHVAAAVQAAAPVQSSQPVPIAAPAPKRPPARVETETAEFYQVQPGDSLFRIALDHGLEHRQLSLWNGLSDPSKIKAGDRLRLKPAPAITGQAAAEPIDESPLVWVWPAKGEIVGRFGGAAGARGLDIAGRAGAPVFAAAPGRVVYVGAGLRGYGKLIIIKHSKELLTAYGHNEQILVAEGESVKAGQTIAVMGDSDAERVKLHFEIREFGKPVDPLTFLPG